MTNSTVVATSSPADSTIKKVVARTDTANIDNIIKDLSGENPVAIEGKEYVINNRSNLDTISRLDSVAAKYVYYKFLEYGYGSHFATEPYPNLSYLLNGNLGL